jgi:hypothetical protein
LEKKNRRKKGGKGMNVSSGIAIGGGAVFLLALYFLWTTGIAGFIMVLVVGGLAAFVALDVYGKPSSPPPAQDASGAAVGLTRPSEVFYVADNKFTFEQAPAVCAAYGGKLASYNELEDAYSKGASWCGYGWTEGGMALFPMNEKEWNKKYKNDPKHSCGRPGINGGYLAPDSKFGVTCKGPKPAMTHKELAMAFAGVTKSADKKFTGMVQKIKDEIDHLRVAPFNSKPEMEMDGKKGMQQSSWTWSEYDTSSATSALSKVTAPTTSGLASLESTAGSWATALKSGVQKIGGML